ncbi:hypothetical protein APHAL10511_004074 [Amanita phalloides]|nr:hypothetical protein APHAL10511_004074 [Amanita phalloides]
MECHHEGVFEYIGMLSKSQKISGLMPPITELFMPDASEGRHVCFCCTSSKVTLFVAQPCSSVGGGSGPGHRAHYNLRCWTLLIPLKAGPFSEDHSRSTSHFILSDLNTVLHKNAAQPIDSGLVSRDSTQSSGTSTSGQSSHSLDKPSQFDLGTFFSGLVGMAQHYAGLRRSYDDLTSKLEARGFFSQPELVTREVPVEYNEYVARGLEDELEVREFDDMKFWGDFVTAKLEQRDFDSEDYWSKFALHELGGGRT